MPYNLKGRNILITGGSRGLGALVAEKFAEEGSNVMINYVSAADRAEDVKQKCEGFGVKAAIVQGNAGVPDDNLRIVKETVDQLGGLDVIIANAGWTRFSDFKDLNAMNLEEWNKCWATNVMSHLQLMQAAGPIFDSNPDGGVYLISSSVAGITQGGSSMAYSVTKAAGIHLMKCIAITQGPKTRINAILPGLLLTEWGNKYGEERINGLREAAALKHETYLDDTADMYISTAKNTSITGETIRIDAGLAIR